MSGAIAMKDKPKRPTKADRRWNAIRRAKRMLANLRRNGFNGNPYDYNTQQVEHYVWGQYVANELVRQ